MRKYEFQDLIEQYCGRLSTAQMAKAMGLSRRMFYYRMSSGDGFSHQELAKLARITSIWGLSLEQLEVWHKEIYR